jgi:hypothetical protein
MTQVSRYYMLSIPSLKPVRLEMAPFIQNTEINRCLNPTKQAFTNELNTLYSRMIMGPELDSRLPAIANTHTQQTK